MLHVVLLGLLMLVAATFLTRSGASRTAKELDIVFYRPALRSQSRRLRSRASAKGGNRGGKGQGAEAPGKGPGTLSSRAARQRAFPWMPRRLSQT